MEFFDSAPDGWALVTLDDLGEVNRGRSRHRPRHAPELYGGPYPFLQTGDVKAADGLISTHRQTYNEEGLAQSRLWPAGTMCITIAANIAETAILSYPACFPDSIIGFVPNPDRADVYFIEYAFRNLKRMIHHVSEDSGTVQDNINLEFLSELTFPVPVDVTDQHAIASILRSIDKKIQHNRRQTHLFNQFCATIFNSWFIEYEPVTAASTGQPPAFMSPRLAGLFPDSFEDSELGPIPRGWSVVEFSELLSDLESGARPQGGAVGVLDGVPSLGAEHIEPIGEFHYENVRYVSEDYFARMRRGIVKDRDIALYKDGAYVGKTTMWETGFPYERCCVNEHVFLLRAKPEIGQEYLYFLMTDPGTNAELINLNSNSAQPGLSQGALGSLRVVLPPPELLDEFRKIATPFIDGIFRNARQNNELSEMRDVLLAPLVTGELKMSGEFMKEAI